MRLRIARDATIDTLRDSVSENLERYRYGDFDFLNVDSSTYLELPVDAVDSELGDLKLPVSEDLFEAHNCIVVHKYLRNLTPYDARDQRLWCYLSHTIFLEYARIRWPIPEDDEKAIKHIDTHFFARTNRQIERDNAVSRLWWMAHLCHRVDGLSQEVALNAFLHRADVRANIIERPTVAQSTHVFSVILKGLSQSLSGNEALFNRATFRKVMMELNSIGGFRLLDALPEGEINKIFLDVISNRVGLAAL